MAVFDDSVAKIRTARYGKEVRQSFIDALTECYKYNQGTRIEKMGILKSDRSYFSIKDDIDRTTSSYLPGHSLVGPEEYNAIKNVNPSYSLVPGTTNIYELSITVSSYSVIASSDPSIVKVAYGLKKDGAYNVVRRRSDGRQLLASATDWNNYASYIQPNDYYPFSDYKPVCLVYISSNGSNFIKAQSGESILSFLWYSVVPNNRDVVAAIEDSPLIAKGTAVSLAARLTAIENLLRNRSFMGHITNDSNGNDVKTKIVSAAEYNTSSKDPNTLYYVYDIPPTVSSKKFAWTGQLKASVDEPINTGFNPIQPIDYTIALSFSIDATLNYDYGFDSIGLISTVKNYANQGIPGYIFPDGHVIVHKNSAQYTPSFGSVAHYYSHSLGIDDKDAISDVFPVTDITSLMLGPMNTGIDPTKSGNHIIVIRHKAINGYFSICVDSPSNEMMFREPISYTIIANDVPLIIGGYIDASGQLQKASVGAAMFIITSLTINNVFETDISKYFGDN